MRFSNKFKSSSCSLPSPDGRLVATLLPLGIHIRVVERLDEVANVVPLPDELSSTAVVSFQWSPSSRRLLVATADVVFVTAVLPAGDEEDSGRGQLFRAVIRNPALPVVGKPAFVGFGSSDDQVCLCSAFGIKFVVFDLQTSKTVEISHPKLHSPTSACSRGFSFRPASHHLALLTRTAGKDWISIHSAPSAALVTSWAPDTIDAQGLLWCPDGRWLAVMESPAYGHKILFYTPDGHFFKAWTGRCSSDGGSAVGSEGEGRDNTTNVAAADLAADEALGLGVKIARFSPNARFMAVGDTTRRIRIIDMASLVGIWQEQINPSAPSASSELHTFIEAAQAISPPGRTSPNNPDGAISAVGASLLSFDKSSAYLVTRLEDAPSTVWIWDLRTWQLCTVLMFHANVSSAVWHPSAARALLVACDGEQHRGVGFVWSHPSNAPAVVDYSRHFSPATNDGQPPNVPMGSHRPSWLSLEDQPLLLFYSDGKEFALAAPGANRGSKASSAGLWPKAASSACSTIFDNGSWTVADQRREESPLQLVPAEICTEGDSDLEDTFHYKREE
ncbi:Six-bladed beta-propeller, TolB-like protein [Niveomyces insectorum RCEF 264]|uniref:Six-bladed beta-propeller, TolB-like protein n=1 Tax=Niveomyces insectorum RCEF 264 TaxID=1081102 RepID=A0A167ZYZ3_9HYPO|nr:Six-bladed beta-propeller, TolB-like protein [Niveomyces insectorum RCEF 264]